MAVEATTRVVTITTIELSDPMAVAVVGAKVAITRITEGDAVDIEIDPLERSPRKLIDPLTIDSIMRRITISITTF